MRKRSRGGEEGLIYRVLCWLRDGIAYAILSNQRIDGNFQRPWLSTLRFDRPLLLQEVNSNMKVIIFVLQKHFICLLHILLS